MRIEKHRVFSYRNIHFKLTRPSHFEIFWAIRGEEDARNGNAGRKKTKKQTRRPKRSFLDATEVDMQTLSVHEACAQDGALEKEDPLWRSLRGETERGNHSFSAESLKSWTHRGYGFGEKSQTLMNILKWWLKWCIILVLQPPQLSKSPLLMHWIWFSFWQ